MLLNKSTIKEINPTTDTAKHYIGPTPQEITALVSL